MECLINKFNSFQLRKANTDCGSKLHIVLGNLHDSTYDKQKNTNNNRNNNTKAFKHSRGFSLFSVNQPCVWNPSFMWVQKKMSTSSFEENEKKSWFSYLEVKYHEITEKKKNMEYLTFSNFKKKLSAVLVKFTSRVLDHFQHTTDRQKFISILHYFTE